MKIFFKNILRVSILLVISIAASAQDFRYPVVARITQTAPYPIYLSEYANPAQQNFSIQLQVRDNILATRRVKLKLFIESSSINIQSTPVVRNETIIELSAGQTLDLPSNLVANYFENYNLAISPAQYAQSLPEGAYRFGIQVIDANTGLALSGIQYAIPVWITVNEPPVWVLPQNESVQAIENPQNVNFQWVPRHISATDVEYEFTITELNVPLGFTGNIQNLFFAQPAHYTVRTRATNLNYNYTLPPLLTNKIYAYRVRAIAKNGLEDIGLFRNNGFSEVQWFRYMEAILPPVNETVIRVDNGQGFRLSWTGSENHEEYLIRYRERGSDWTDVTIASSQTNTEANNHEFTINNQREGSYEFQVAAKGNQFQENQWGQAINFKDPLPRPITNTPGWKNSKLAAISWYGDRRFENYQFKYRATNSEVWLDYGPLQRADILVEEESQTFNLNINGLDSLQSYYFKVVGVDAESDTSSSQQAYLKYWDIESIILTEEKTVVGNVYWSFLDREVSLGAVSGLPQDSTFVPKNAATFIHDDSEVSGDKYPLQNINLEIFADTACTVLLKSIQANRFGGFRINFPAEGLRGGLLPSRLVLKISHPTFGNFKKEINPTIFDKELNIGDWVIPAKTFRYTPYISGSKDYELYPDEHSIKIYRRASGLAIAPYMQYENFGNGIIETTKINNEDFYLVAELEPGQTAAGMFYGREEHNPINQFLVIVDGRLPYEQKKLYQEMPEKNDVYELQSNIQLNLGQPHIYGDITFESSTTSGSVKLELTSTSGYTETISSVSPYRFNLPLSELEQFETYTIKTYINNNFKGLETFNLNPESLGTRKDLLIGRNKMVAVAAQLRDNDGELLAKSTFTIGGRSYNSNSLGQIFFWAQENTEVEISLQKNGYTMTPYWINVSNQLPAIEDSGTEEFSTTTELRSKLRADLGRLQSQNVSFVSTTTLTYWAAFALTHSADDRLFNSVNEYHGASFIAANTDAQLKPFEIKFIVQDIRSSIGISNVIIMEDDLVQIGKTNNNGILTFTSTKGRGTRAYKVIPQRDSFLPYPEKEIAFEFPEINSGASSHEIIIKLDNRSFIRGKIIEEGTGEPLANATVKLEYLTGWGTVDTDANGMYKSLGFSYTEEENFIIITAEKEGYFRKVAHMAAAKSYGRQYERDLYLKPKPVQETTTEEVVRFKRLFGFSVEITESTYVRLEYGTPIWDYSGILYDRDGNSYTFSSPNSYTIEGGRYIIPGNSNILLTPRYGENLYCKRLPVDPETPIYGTSNGNLNEGFIYTETLSFDKSKMSADFVNLYENSDRKKIEIEYNTSIPRMDTDRTPFPIAYSKAGIPILQIQLFPKVQGKGKNKRVEELKSYYEDYEADRAKVSALFEESDDEALYEFKNFVFASISVRPRGIELNNLVVMPLMSLDNVHISLLNIDRLRLAYDAIDEVLIDYSLSPRKISFGEDVVQAQIEEVHASDEGIDIVYFTNNGGNVIKPASPDISEIQYNSNGVFYSDYKNQRELVQTAAVLNPVYMFRFPTPAMGPGYRIKITSTTEADSELGEGYGTVLPMPPTGRTNSLATSTSKVNYVSVPDIEPYLVMDGISTVTLAPHIFKMDWKYEDNTQKWKTDLASFVSTDFWGYTVLRPVKVEIAGAKIDSVEYTPGEDIPETDIEKGILNVTYGISIPIVGGIKMQTKAKWNEEKQQFIRENVQAEASTSIASLLSFTTKFILLLDTDDGSIDGLFAKIAGKLELAEVNKVSLSASGGYVNIQEEGDDEMVDNRIFGFAATAGDDKMKKNSLFSEKTVVMNNLGFAFLFDQKNDAIFMQISGDFEFGKKKVYDTPELKQFTPKPKDAIERERRAKKDSEITKRWETAKSTIQKGEFEPKIVLFNEMFMMGEGNSGFDADSDGKSHKVSIKKAEAGIAISKSQGFTLTGSGILSIEGAQLLETAFLISLVNVTSDTVATNWRIFVGIPSFTRDKAGPIHDLSADLQIDFGNQGKLANFLLMGGVQGELRGGKFYVKVGAKFLLGINAQANTTTLATSTRAGGQTLSKTASAIVKFMGSNFNSIAEKSIQQRTSFFNAIDKDTFLETKYEYDDDGNIADSSSRFSGFYIGGKVAVIFGFNKDFENDLVAGSGRLGIGGELQLGFLKLIGKPALEARLKVSIVVEAAIRARAPIEADLFNANLEILPFCFAAKTEDPDYEDWDFRLLLTLVNLDKVIGPSVVADPACNSFGFTFYRPCLYIEYYLNTEIPEYEDGKFDVTTVPGNFSESTCPIEW